MPSLAIARGMILDTVRPLPAEEVDLATADGRVLAEDVAAPFDLPHWDNSAMDGFAVRAADCGPGVSLEIAGTIAAGDREVVDVRPGACVRILTGARMPPGADSVIPFEEVEEAEGAILLARGVEPGNHVRVRGGDMRTGDIVLRAGAIVGPPEVAVLATLGRTTATVHRRPRVAILSTGNELLQPGEPLRPGAIYDSNASMLAAAVTRAGGIPVRLGVAPDEVDALRILLRTGLEADVLLTSAGVSTGERDLVRDTLGGLGARELFYKVDIQPGRPFACAVAGDTCILSLPGNPVAALLTFEMLVRPALRRLQGLVPAATAPARARLAHDVQPRPDRVTLVRVVVEDRDGGLWAGTSGRQATGFLATLANADAIALVPPGPDPLATGTEVEIHFLRHENAMGEGRS